MRRRRHAAMAVAALAVAVVLAVAGPARRASGEQDRCGFHPIEDHRITDRRHISCAAARQVLLRLRGDHEMIPMICGRPRSIGGWWVADPQRRFAVVENRYTRGRATFLYWRVQHPRRTYCRPPYGSGEPVG